MIWEAPGYLFLIVLLVIIIIATIYHRKKWRELRRRYFSDAVFSKLYNAEIERNRKLHQTFFYSSLVFLIIALAGPKIGTEVREVKRQGIDILVMLDVSKSMKAEDVRPNRLDKAKFEILRMVDRLRGDRIGLITFTGEAILLSPLTADYSAFRLFLNLADTDAMPSSTTDFSAGMRVALDAFEASSDANQEAAKVLLILSDGEDHGPEFTNTLQQFRDKGIFIFTVGIGTTAGGTIPVYNLSTGRLIEYLRDAAGQVVITKLEPRVLREIAEQGLGTYYEISRSSDGMDGFLSQIEELEKREFATQEFADYKNQYQWFAGIGILLLFISVVIPQYQPIKT